ncbi:MAG TPA: malate dehydrogenase [Nitrospirae bacterium]|nr:malate dehydrogenase [bacterium BMS3Abin10]HDH50769.1 malate dehydrogenase [Nitrospirota bacterium]HDK17710.1 malate dehydrogenase [Nitrospirota bacterium]HDK41551.1 malate dehydrogenase [Nitrospirota bacterium]HDZ84506.1 malate dehydrogenase [Nitrospirota bacterium]
MNKKITVVGAGNVGTTTAQLIAQKNLADVVLIDIVEGIPQGKALDIQEACPLWLSPARVTGTNDYKDTAGSDIVVITAGLARKPGMSRDDLLKANADIIKETAGNIAKTSPDAVVIVVTNPMDAMAHLAQKVTGFPYQRVIGMGGVLDSTRMRTFIALELGAHPEEVQTMVLGGHGDLMVPLPRLTTVKGKCISDVLPDEKINKIIERTKNGGAEIVGFLKTGSAYYAPAASVVEMIEVMFGLKSETLSCSVYLDGEYGVKGTYLGVPVRLSSKGVDEIIDLELDENEKIALHASADAVRGLIEKII